MKCPNCSKEVQDGSRFCNHCGHEFKQENTKSCPGCGHVIPADSKFCPDCGSSIVVQNQRRAIAICDSDDGRHILDNFDEWDNSETILFEYGNLKYKKDNLLLNKDDGFVNLGKYVFAIPNDYFLVAIKEEDDEENKPYDIYTKEGKKLSSSGKYVILDYMKGGICLCKISKSQYGIVDLINDRILQVLYDNPKQCGYPVLSSESNIAAYAKSDSQGDSIYLYDYTKNAIERLNSTFNFVRDNGRPRCLIRIVSNNYILVNESTVYSSPRPYHVINKNGDICFTFEPRSYPEIRSGIVGAYESGFFNVVTGKGYGKKYHADFVLNSCLIYCKQIGEKSWQREHGIIDVNTDKLLLNGMNLVYPVLDNKSEVRYVFSFGYSAEPSVVYDTVEHVKHELQTVGDELQTMGFFNGYFNLCTGEYDTNCIDDQRKQDITIYSTVYDDSWNVVFEDKWGNYLGVFGGYADNRMYALSKNGEFGYITEGAFNVLSTFSYPEMYRLLPLYLTNRFLIYHANGVTLIDLYGNVIKELDNRFCLHQFVDSENKFSGLEKENTLFMSYRKVALGYLQDEATSLLSGDYLTNLETGFQFGGVDIDINPDYSIDSLWSNVGKF